MASSFRIRHSIRDASSPHYVQSLFLRFEATWGYMARQRYKICHGDIWQASRGGRRVEENLQPVAPWPFPAALCQLGRQEQKPECFKRPIEGSTASPPSPPPHSSDGNSCRCRPPCCTNKIARVLTRDMESKRWALIKMDDASSPFFSEVLLPLYKAFSFAQLINGSLLIVVPINQGIIAILLCKQLGAELEIC